MVISTIQLNYNQIVIEARGIKEEQLIQVEHLAEDPIILVTIQLKFWKQQQTSMPSLWKAWAHSTGLLAQTDQDFQAPQSSFNNNVPSMSAVVATPCTPFDSSWSDLEQQII